MLEENLSRIATSPDGKRYSIEANVRFPWPMALDLYEFLLGWLHGRVFGYQVRVKPMPVTPSAPALRDERVAGRKEAERRVAELAVEITAGRCAGRS